MEAVHSDSTKSQILNKGQLVLFSSITYSIPPYATISPPEMPARKTKGQNHNIKHTRSYQGVKGNPQLITTCYEILHA